MLLRLVSWGRLLRRLNSIRRKVVRMMEYSIIKFRLNWLYLRDSSIELRVYCWRTIKLRKLWRCIRNCINGIRLLKLLRKKNILMLLNLRIIILVGCWKLDKKKKLVRSNRIKEIISMLLNCIWKVVSLQKLPMLSTIIVLVSLKNFWRKLPAILLLLICLRKLVNFIKKWICSKKLWIVMSKAMPSKKQLIWLRTLNPDSWQACKNVGATTWCQSNRPKPQSTTTSRPKRSKKQSKPQSCPVNGTKQSNSWPTKPLKSPVPTTARSPATTPQSVNTISPRNISLKLPFL